MAFRARRPPQRPARHPDRFVRIRSIDDYVEGHRWTGAEEPRDICPGCQLYRVIKIDHIARRWCCTECYRAQVEA